MCDNYGKRKPYEYHGLVLTYSHKAFQGHHPVIAVVINPRTTFSTIFRTIPS